MAFGLYEFPHSHNYDSDLRELIQLVKTYRDDYDKLASTVDKAVTRFNEIEQEFEELNDAVTGLYDYVDDEIELKINEYKQIIEVRMAEMQGIIDDALKAIIAILPAAKAYADAKDEETKAILRAEMVNMVANVDKRLTDIEKQLKALHVNITHPNTGFSASIGSVVEYIRDKYRGHALTNNEYSDLGLTNDEYTAELLTDEQYLLEGKRLLQKKWLRRLNPVTGMLTRESNVNSWIATYCAETLNVDEYTAQDLTNDEYAAKNLTNLDYFFTKAANLPWA